MIWDLLSDVPWVVFIAVWVIQGMKTRRTQTAERAASRVGVMVLLIVGYALIFSAQARLGVLGQPMVRRHWADLAVAGAAFVWIGIGLAIWARWHLGEYWSARVTIKEDHQLICSGPYARFRHPIYSGLDLATLGSAMVIDRWGCLVGFVLVAAGYWIKARKEEAMLSNRFGETFREHSRRTGFLLPKFGAPG